MSLLYDFFFGDIYKCKIFVLFSQKGKEKRNMFGSTDKDFPGDAIKKD